MFKGVGGAGVPIFFLILTYVVGLCFLLPKWAQPPLNSQRFNFGGRKREGCFREISKMYRKSHIKKKRQKKGHFSLKKEYLELSRRLGMVKIGQDGHKVSLSKRYAAIFEIFIFGRFLAFFVKKNTFFRIFQISRGWFRAKNQNLKNRRIPFRETQFMSILANFQLPKCSR